MLTEEEAKTKWCPFDRSYLMQSLSIDTGEMRCITSGCMAWRWEHAGNDMIRQTVKSGAERQGYCGLAGKPE